MPARAPFKNLCPRERTRLPMLKESASLSCPVRAALVLTQCFRRGQLSARCLRAPRLHISAAPSLDNPAASPNVRPFFGSVRRPFFSPWFDRPHPFVPRRRAQALLRRELSPAAPLSPLQSRLLALTFPSPASLTHPLGSARLLRPAPLPFSLAPYSLAPASHAPESCPAPTDAPPVFAPPFGTVPFQPCTSVSHSCSTREKIRFPGEITNFFSGIRPPPLDLAPPPCYRFFELKNSEGCFPKAHRDPA